MTYFASSVVEIATILCYNLKTQLAVVPSYVYTYPKVYYFDKDNDINTDKDNDVDNDDGNNNCALKSQATNEIKVFQEGFLILTTLEESIQIQRY